MERIADSRGQSRYFVCTIQPVDAVIPVRLRPGRLTSDIVQPRDRLRQHIPIIARTAVSVFDREQASARRMAAV